MKTNIRKNDKNPAIEDFCSASNVKEKNLLEILTFKKYSLSFVLDFLKD